MTPRYWEFRPRTHSANSGPSCALKVWYPEERSNVAIANSIPSHARGPWRLDGRPSKSRAVYWPFVGHAQDADAWPIDIIGRGLASQDRQSALVLTSIVWWLACSAASATSVSGEPPTLPEPGVTVLRHRANRPHLPTSGTSRSVDLWRRLHIQMCHAPDLPPSAAATDAWDKSTTQTEGRTVRCPANVLHSNGLAITMWLNPVERRRFSSEDN